MPSTAVDLGAFKDSLESHQDSNHKPSFVEAPVAPSPDWPPLIGPIDLTVHDCTHAFSKTEWWYITAHVSSSSSYTTYSFFAAFFRMAVAENADGSVRYSHSIT